MLEYSSLGLRGGLIGKTRSKKGFERDARIPLGSCAGHLRKNLLIVTSGRLEVRLLCLI